MTTKKFIIKTVVMIFAFAIISTIAITLLQSPIITNEIALGQMQNDNVAFLIMDNYNKLVPFISIVYGCITLGFVGRIAYDTYKFIIQKKKEKKENEKD
jgi:hypothetical protein